jgi:hypothetical protein
VVVDGSTGVQQTTQVIERLFADALAAGPHARTRGERQALLREMNQAVLTQVRGYYARPWADGDPEAVLREFVPSAGPVTRCLAARPLGDGGTRGKEQAGSKRTGLLAVAAGHRVLDALDLCRILGAVGLDGHGRPPVVLADAAGLASCHDLARSDLVAPPPPKV